MSSIIYFIESPIFFVAVFQSFGLVIIHYSNVKRVHVAIHGNRKLSLLGLDTRMQKKISHDSVQRKT